MGIQERKIRHKEDLKQNILLAAKKLFLKNGFEATSIRKIAAEIEFSPTTIYLYYKDKSDIAYALHAEGFKLFAEKLSVTAFIDHPFERLKAMGRIYMQFALENSDFYQLMFVLKEPVMFLDNHCVDEEWEEGKQAFKMLLDTVVQCQEQGYLGKTDPQVTALLIWSTMHGLCTMKISGHMELVVTNKKILTQVDDVFQHAFEGFIRMLESLK